MELLWTALGSLFGGGLLVWSMVSFVIDKRDKNHEEERRQFYKNFNDFETRITAEINYLKKKVESISEINTAIAVHNEKLSTMTTKFMEYSHEVRNIIEKHASRLEEFGRVIKLGK